MSMRNLEMKYARRERKLRSSYRKRIALVFFLALILGLIVGAIVGYKWHKPGTDASVPAEGELIATPAPTTESAPAEGEQTTTPAPEMELSWFDETEPTVEPTAEPTAEPTPELTAEPTPEPTAEPIPQSKAVSIPEPTAEPTPEPTAEPTPEPTAEPTPEPTAELTPEPTAEPTPEPTAEPTPKPAATTAVIAVGESGSFDTPVTFDEEYAFELQVDKDGKPVKDADAEGVITVPVTMKVSRNIENSYYKKNYSDKYVLKGNEAGVELQFSMDASEDVEAVSLQEALLIVLTNDANEVQPGYQLTSAEIGGETGSVIIPGANAVVYKRYNYGDVEDLNRVSVTYYKDGVPTVVYFSLVDEKLEAARQAAKDAISYAKGDKSDEVKEVQQLLIDKGFLNGSADGDFGKKTEDAVKAAQKEYGLEETGVVNYDLLVALNDGDESKVELPGLEDYTMDPASFDMEEDTTEESSAEGEESEQTEEPEEPAEPEEEEDEGLKYSKGDKGEEISRMQSKLIKMGFLNGSPDGQFGQFTEDAVKKAQKKLGMEQTGVATQEFLDKLYAYED